MKLRTNYAIGIGLGIVATAPVLLASKKNSPEQVSIALDRGRPVAALAGTVMLIAHVRAFNRMRKTIQGKRNEIIRRYILRSL